MGVAVRSNVTHQNEGWSLVPGELLKKYNDDNPYLKQKMTDEQSLEDLYYKPCSNCGARWQVGCCNSLSTSGVT